MQATQGHLVKHPHPSQHRLATDPHPIFRPFISTALVAHISKLYKELDDDVKGNYLKILDCANRLVKRSAVLGVNSAPGSKTPYSMRIESIANKCEETKKYKVGARLLMRETMRLMCAMRAPDDSRLPTVKRVNVDVAVNLLYESFSAMISPANPAAKAMKELGMVASIGCGSWGEVFFEKHQTKVDEITGKPVLDENGDPIVDVELFIYAGIFSDLFCSFVNKYIVNQPDNSNEADQMLAALLEFTSIHPCAEQCVVFQSDAEKEDKGDVVVTTKVVKEIDVSPAGASDE